MGIEVLLIVSGVLVLVTVLGRRRMLQKRFADNREKFAEMNFENLAAAEIDSILSRAPALKGDGKFAFNAVGTIPFANNYEVVRLARRIYFVEPTIIEVLLIPEPANLERKNAVAITLDAKVLGYVPAKESSEMHSYLLAHTSGLKATARIYLGSRPEFNALWLDLAKPLRLESRKNPRPMLGPRESKPN